MGNNKIKKESKYHNKQIIFNGVMFDSKGEMRRYCFLKMFENSGLIRNLQYHKKYELIPKGIVDITLHFATGDKHIQQNFPRTRYYEADFVYTVVSTGEEVVEDFKGFETTEFKQKAELFYLIYGKRIKITKEVNDPVN